ncbi:NADH-quinone oxidoreductase subunit C [Vallicoccus soli]|uniref:NADH-quinone oxidoreductase subunit C n=1 Tax=Vallicoccus soli TaxID=2339232 RepID=A0A3A3ZEH6_9ACTN|nr:NADH-quinone oxidoreductase subunit C [Vallicoccus soli]RJK93419.1 NADH-quinone oxidoreductase subunit C [Vallicoccus soli]
MGPERLAERVLVRFPQAQVEESYGDELVHVDPGSWTDLLAWARDELGCTYLDWLSAADELEEGFAVVACLWDVSGCGDGGGGLRRVLLRTRVPRDAARLPTVTHLFRGAGWHERETAEMFGIAFDGHPSPGPLLLPDGFEGHPLRKEFVLASRAAKAWPGAKEPGESDADVAASGAPGPGRGGASRRRRTLPPGVPDPSWGPRPPSDPALGAGDGPGQPHG